MQVFQVYQQNTAKQIAIRLNINLHIKAGQDKPIERKGFQEQSSQRHLHPHCCESHKNNIYARDRAQTTAGSVIASSISVSLYESQLVYSVDHDLWCSWFLWFLPIFHRFPKLQREGTVTISNSGSLSLTNVWLSVFISAPISYQRRSLWLKFV